MQDLTTRHLRLQEAHVKERQDKVSVRDWFFSPPILSFLVLHSESNRFSPRSFPPSTTRIPPPLSLCVTHLAWPCFSRSVAGKVTKRLLFRCGVGAFHAGMVCWFPAFEGILLHLRLQGHRFFLHLGFSCVVRVGDSVRWLLFSLEPPGVAGCSFLTFFPRTCYGIG
ncbi:hypothetical protein NDU88_004414 [Pleurodeles waltl]|uniref:Uncharacterized protein n=1 Tax=Pleurodeles waltl TaxID=8319 RepID=A0AAV7LI77_PLEWA|nr:hypothetical protein NDU88_004414 [Pleurodeles waltl]